MAMPAAMKLKWVEGAALVVQAAIERVDVPEVPLPGRLAECFVTAKIRRVFIGHCELDALVTFGMTIYSELPPPGDRYEELQKLKTARFVEAYLAEVDGDPNRWHAIDTLLIEELGSEPTLLTWLRQSVAETKR